MFDVAMGLLCGCCFSHATNSMGGGEPAEFRLAVALMLS